MLLYGILYVVTGSPAITGALAYVGKTEAEINAFDPELMIILSYELRVVGIAYMNLGIAYIFIINFGFRKKEKWAWIATLIAFGGFGVPLVLTSISVMGIDIDIIILIIVLIIQIVGEIITYKSFFGAK
ncbi:MAG: hypothetical protein HWN80_15600 [Candidatus Lokiarchaeota archaeon]|nr:hypothetical protein [Candidatus Lokiarchaeota archaeon]